MVELFQRDQTVMPRHTINVLKKGELEREATVAKIAPVDLQDMGVTNAGCFLSELPIVCEQLCYNYGLMSSSHLRI